MEAFQKSRTLKVLKMKSIHKSIGLEDGLGKMIIEKAAAG